jgi:hypothetical protein
MSHAKKLLSLLVVSYILNSSVMTNNPSKTTIIKKQTKKKYLKYSKNPSTLHYKSDKYVTDILEKAKVAFTLQAVECKNLLAINYFNESNDFTRAKLLTPFIKSNVKEFEVMIPANYEINMLGQPPVKKALPLPKPGWSKPFLLGLIRD